MSQTLTPREIKRKQIWNIFLNKLLWTHPCNIQGRYLNQNQKFILLDKLSKDVKKIRSREKNIQILIKSIFIFWTSSENFKIIYWSYQDISRFRVSEFTFAGKIYAANFIFLHWIERYKEPSGHLCCGWELWRLIKVLVLDLDQGMSMVSYQRRISVPNFSSLY